MIWVYTKENTEMKKLNDGLHQRILALQKQNTRFVILEKTEEELKELKEALIDIYRESNNIDPITLSSVLDEMADVYIMLLQLQEEFLITRDVELGKLKRNKFNNKNIILTLVLFVYLVRQIMEIGVVGNALDSIIVHSKKLRVHYDQLLENFDLNFEDLERQIEKKVKRQEERNAKNR